VLTLTERQRLIRRTAAEFARRELAPDAAMRDRERRFPAEAFAKMAEQNFAASQLAASRAGKYSRTITFAK
jgi:butyryl-CoA dehydrogenase